MCVGGGGFSQLPLVALRWSTCTAAENDDDDDDGGSIYVACGVATSPTAARGDRSPGCFRQYFVIKMKL